VLLKGVLYLNSIYKHVLYFTAQQRNSLFFIPSLSSASPSPYRVRQTLKNVLLNFMLVQKPSRSLLDSLSRFLSTRRLLLQRRLSIYLAEAWMIWPSMLLECGSVGLHGLIRLEALHPSRQVGSTVLLRKPFAMNRPAIHRPSRCIDEKASD
jgi:hypothetical protein